MIFIQKAKPLKATRREKVTGYAGTELTAPSIKENIREWCGIRRYSPVLGGIGWYQVVLNCIKIVLDGIGWYYKVLGDITRY